MRSGHDPKRACAGFVGDQAACRRVARDWFPHNRRSGVCAAVSRNFGLITGFLWRSIPGAPVREAGEKPRGAPMRRESRGTGAWRSGEGRRARTMVRGKDGIMDPAASVVDDRAGETIGKADPAAGDRGLDGSGETAGTGGPGPLAGRDGQFGTPGRRGLARSAGRNVCRRRFNPPFGEGKRMPALSNDKGDDEGRQQSRRQRRGTHAHSSSFEASETGGPPRSGGLRGNYMKADESGKQF